MLKIGCGGREYYKHFAKFHIAVLGNVMQNFAPTKGDNLLPLWSRSH